MAEETKPGSDIKAKIKLGALIGAGAILLWFLVVNLWGEPWSLSLWPITRVPAPATLFIFVFLLVGFVAGFGLCFWWLRGHRFGDAIHVLTEEERRKAQAAGADEPPKDRERGTGTA